MHLNVTGLENRVQGHAEQLAAGVALIDAYPSCLSFQLADAIGTAAVRTNWAVRPYDAFQLRIGGRFIVKVWPAQNACHGPPLLMERIIADISGFSKCNIAFP